MGERGGWEEGKKRRDDLKGRPRATSIGQAASTVGGSQENGIIHVLLAHSVYVSLSSCLALSLDVMYSQHFALKTSALKKKKGTLHHIH